MRLLRVGYDNEIPNRITLTDDRREWIEFWRKGAPSKKKLLRNIS